MNEVELYRGIVMPAHCDLYGHMNVRQYSAFFDDAGWHMFGRAGISLTDLRSRGLGSVVATLKIDFHHEMTAGQLLVITGAITRVGEKSFDYEMRMYEAESMQLCATQRTTEVCFDTRARKSARWPDEVRQQLEAVSRKP
jgi:acyl-CoA thioester hydrolase